MTVVSASIPRLGVVVAGVVLTLAACGSTDARTMPGSSTTSTAMATSSPLPSTTRAAVAFVPPAAAAETVISIAGSCAQPPEDLEEALAAYFSYQDGERVVRATVTGVAGPPKGFEASPAGRPGVSVVRTPFALTGIQHLYGGSSPIDQVWVSGGQAGDTAMDETQVGLTPGSDVILHLTPAPEADGVEGFYGLPLAVVSGDRAHIPGPCLRGVRARGSQEVTKGLPVFTYRGFGSRSTSAIELPTEVLLEDLARAGMRPHPGMSGS